jgi:dynein heavy chain
LYLTFPVTPFLPLCSYKKKIKQLEDDLLFRLSTSTGNLLDDTELIDVLAVTKQTAQDVNEKLANATETNRKITEACEEYRPVARRATLVYFLIAEFSNVNVMYQTSLKQFNQLYEGAIDHSEKAVMPSKRINNIIEYLTYSLYKYVQRGLFERHKLTFALMLAMRILVGDRKLTENEVQIFLKGGAALDIKAVRKKPKEWIPDAVWLNAIAMTGLTQFQVRC